MLVLSLFVLGVFFIFAYCAIEQHATMRMVNGWKLYILAGIAAFFLCAAIAAHIYAAIELLIGLKEVL